MAARRDLRTGRRSTGPGRRGADRRRRPAWLWFSPIGWFLAGSATAEAQQAVLASRLRGIRASQVMTPDPVTLPRSMTIREFIDDYMFRARHQSFPVTGDGGDTVTGLVTLDRIKHAPGQPA